jgi:hypothetical protein
MRRALSILLVLFFGLGPLAATLDASDEARLPICCRRNGSHHCSISGDALARIVQASSGSTPVLAAPGQCPLYPGTAPATISPIHALTTASSASFAVQGHALSAQAPQLAARSTETSTNAVRGPPDSVLG